MNKLTQVCETVGQQPLTKMYQDCIHSAKNGWNGSYGFGPCKKHYDRANCESIEQCVGFELTFSELWQQPIGGFPH
jgi:hypothetical protein